MKPMQKKTNKPKDKRINHKYKCALCPYSTSRLDHCENHERTHLSDKPFKCLECPFKSKWQSSLTQHIQNVHLLRSTSILSRPFPCPHPGCSYAAKDQRQLTKHSKIHSDEKSFICSFPNCNFSANQKTSLIVHTRTHTGVKPFGCQFESCSYAAFTLGHLQTHTRRHTKEKPLQCPQWNCKFSAAHHSTLKQHRFTHSSKDSEETRPSFSCPSCDFSTNYKGNLPIHMQSHGLEKLFKCDEPNCNYEGSSKQKLQRHKLVHSDEKPFVCSFEPCEFRCKRNGDLLNHLKTHSEERRYKCELCPYRGKKRSTVKSHLKSVHSDFRPFKCPEPQCDSAFKRKEYLKSHLLTHQADKKYSCSFPLCEYRAVLASMVRTHELRVHETEKKYKCQLCNFATRDNSNLVLHVRTHTKETPYVCKVEGCQYGANQSSCLSQHQKRNHPHICFNESK